MARLLINSLLLSIALFAGQSVPATEHEGTSIEDDYEMVAWRDRYLELGQDVYEWACAACHAEGLDGAPKMGDRSAWSDRSPLWSAVLLEHAKDGHLEMPAKGGHPYLSDRAVEAAGEYMLTTTFPELPRD